MDLELQRAAEALREASRLLIFTGAGISTESGIPDFRGPNGVWTKVDPSEFTIDRYISRPETRRKAWSMRRDSGVMKAEPNEAHLALAELWTSGRMIGCVTQNIDGLHQRAGLPDEAVVELHGTVHKASCLNCGREWPTTEILERVDAGDDDPHCDCGGIIKVATISFGQAMPAAEMDRAYQMALSCDAAVAVGSTLSVYPAAYITMEAQVRGVPYVIVNLGRTDQDHLADFRIEGKAGEVLPLLIRSIMMA